MSLPKKLTKIPIPRDIHILEGFPKRYPAENLGMVGTQVFVKGREEGRKGKEGERKESYKGILNVSEFF